jgi:hypothetical protein
VRPPHRKRRSGILSRFARLAALLAATALAAASPAPVATDPVLFDDVAAVACVFDLVATRLRLLEDLHAIRFDRPAGLERIRGSGLLRIGMTGDYAPFSVESGGRVRGARGRFSVPYQSGGKTLLARCADRARYRTVFDEIIDGRADVMITDDTEADLQAAVIPWLEDAIEHGVPARDLQAAMLQ